MHAGRIRQAREVIRRLAFVLLLFARTAFADAEAFEPVTIEYEPAAGCAARSELLGKIRKRTSRFRDTSGAARVFVVRVWRGENRFRGQLEVRSGERTTRGMPVEGRTCEEVVDALALSTALAIDPTRTPPPAAPREPEPAPNPPEAAPDTAPEAPVMSTAPVAASRPGWRGEIGAGLVGASGIAPGVTPAAALFAGLVHPAGATLRIGAALGAYAHTSTELGTARLEWISSQTLACPVRLFYASRVGVLPCVAFEAGVLKVSGTDIAFPETATARWLAAGAAARVTWSLGRVVLEAGGDAVVPFYHTEFYFEAPTTPAYRVPVVAGRATMGVVLVVP
jgi:hypothetical protein